MHASLKTSNCDRTAAKRIVTDLVDAFLRERGYSLDTCVSTEALFALARFLGVREIAVAPLAIDGCIHTIAGGYGIYINEGIRPTRQRFTLAHEIGHLLLCKWNQIELGSACQGVAGIEDDSTERFVDMIAAEILMPSGEVLKRIHRRESSWKTLDALSSEFRVSTTAMILRILTLESVFGFWITANEQSVGDVSIRTSADCRLSQRPRDLWRSLDRVIRNGSRYSLEVNKREKCNGERVDLPPIPCDVRLMNDMKAAKHAPHRWWAIGWLNECEIKNSCTSVR